MMHTRWIMIHGVQTCHGPYHKCAMPRHALQDLSYDSILKFSRTNASIVMDDVFERIDNYEHNFTTNIYDLLEIHSYDQVECESSQNQAKDQFLKPPLSPKSLAKV